MLLNFPEFSTTKQIRAVLQLLTFARKVNKCLTCYETRMLFTALATAHNWTLF
jgi:hypothetical protein